MNTQNIIAWARENIPGTVSIYPQGHGTAVLVHRGKFVRIICTDNRMPHAKSVAIFQVPQG